MPQTHATYPHRINAKFSNADMENLGDIRRLAGPKDLSEAIRSAVRAYAAQLRLSHPELAFPALDLPPGPGPGYDTGNVPEADSDIGNGHTITPERPADDKDVRKGKRGAKKPAKPPKPGDNHRPKKGARHASGEGLHRPPRRSKKGADGSVPGPARKPRKKRIGPV